MKIKTYKNAYATLERVASNDTPWITAVKENNGDVIDRIRCDSFRMAREYYAAFCKVAKAR